MSAKIGLASATLNSSEMDRAQADFANAETELARRRSRLVELQRNEAIEDFAKTAFQQHLEAPPRALIERWELRGDVACAEEFAGWVLMKALFFSAEANAAALATSESF